MTLREKDKTTAMALPGSGNEDGEDGGVAVRHLGLPGRDTAPPQPGLRRLIRT